MNIRHFVLAAATLALITGPAVAQEHGVTGAELAAGTFSGASGHVTTGHVAIIETDAGWVISMADDFSFDGAPDPVVALGDGEVDFGTFLSPLTANTGAQTYLITGDINPLDYNQVYVWCEQYSVPLGVADLSL